MKSLILSLVVLAIGANAAFALPGAVARANARGAARVARANASIGVPSATVVNHGKLQAVPVAAVFQQQAVYGYQRQVLQAVPVQAPVYSYQAVQAAPVVMQQQAPVIYQQQQFAPVQQRAVGGCQALFGY